MLENLLKKVILVISVCFLSLRLYLFRVEELYQDNYSSLSSGTIIVFNVLFLLSFVYFILSLSKIIEFKSLKILSLHYLTYLALGSLITYSSIIDYSHADFNDFFLTKFLSTIPIYLIVLVVVSAFVIKRFNYVDSLAVVKRYTAQSDSHSLILLIGIWLVNDYSYSKALLQSIVVNLNTQKVPLFLFQLILGAVASVLVFYGIAWGAQKAIEDIWKNKSSVWISLILSFVLATIFNFFLQLPLTSTYEVFGNSQFIGATAFQIFIFFIVFWLIYLIWNRILPSTLFLIFLIVALSIANSLKVEMRNEPILVTDTIWLSQIKLLFSFVNENYLYYMIIAIGFLIAIAVWLRRKILPGKMISDTRLRVGLLCIPLALYLTIFSIFSKIKDKEIIPNIPILSRLNNEINIDWLGFKMNSSYKSLSYVWVRQLTNRIIEEPDGYSEKTIEFLYDKYKDLAIDINKVREDNISDKTVIIILSESYSNPYNINGTEITYSPVSKIGEIMSRTTSGNMKSDGYGGGTANMEFQALTGLPFYNFSSTVSTLYTEVVPKLQYFPSISNEFDTNNRYVIHPADATNYNRKNVYTQLGYSHLLFLTDYNEEIQNIKFQGTQVSDQTIYENILSKLDSPESQFFSVITMQNHMPWSEEFPADLIAENSNFSDDVNNQLKNYIRLLSHTDNSTAEFLTSLENFDKDITVVFYGDHLPGFYPNSAFENNPSSQYLTDYFIWSNHETKKLDYDLVNSSDFIAALFEHTDSKVSPYYALLTNVLKNASVNQDTLTPEQEEIANDLQMIQYDISLGKGYILNHEDFFTIEK